MGKAAGRVHVLVDQERDAALTQHLLTDVGEQQRLGDGEVGFALERMRSLETRSGAEQLHQEVVEQFREADRESLPPVAALANSSDCCCGSSLRSHNVVPWRSRRDTVMAPSVAMATWPKNWLPQR